jgi:hypothetical protein
MFTIPNLGLSIRNGFILMVSISIILTSITFFNVNDPSQNHKEIKEREDALSSSDYIELYLNRLTHWFSNSIIFLLPYIFKPNLFLYILYEVYLLVVFYLWYLIIQCPISIHEKRILFKQKDKYTVESSNRLQIYISLLIPEQIFKLIFRTVCIINVSLVTLWLIQYYYSQK